LSEPQYSEEEILAARKIREHFPSFCKLLKIKTKDERLIPLVLNRAQKKLWKKMQKQEAKGLPVRIIILKARQLGMSTLVQAYLLWRAITRPNSGGLVVAHLEDPAGELFGKIELMYENLPKPMYDELESIRDTKKKGKKLAWSGVPGGFQLNSLLYVDTARNLSLGRGQTFQTVHLSELAFYDYPEQIMFGLNQAVPTKPNTTVIIESTANGMGNYFHKRWLKAKEGNGYWIPLFLPWTDDPEYRLPVPEDFKLTVEERKLKRKHGIDNEQIMWRRISIEDDCDGDVEKFKQENPIDEDEAFLISGTPYFDRASLNRYEHGLKPPIKEGDIELENGHPVLNEFENGPWRIWKSPVDGVSYVIGADVAGGGAKDFSTAHVVDPATLEVVATYRAKVDPHQFARQLKWAGLAYNKALLAVERNGEGRATVLKLVNDLHYPRMFFHQTEENWNGGVQQSWGWVTSRKTRPAMIAQLRALLREDQVKMYDDRTMTDLKSFVRVDGTKIAEAAVGAWDDCVMSFAIACSSEVRAQGTALMDFDEGPNEPTVSEVTGY